MNARRWLFLIMIMLPAVASAQGGFLWQGVLDIEGWKTDSASRILARGNGKPSGLARIDTWAAFEPIANLIIFGELLGESGSARNEANNEINPKQYGVRFLPSDAFTLQAGLLPQIVGTFSGRRLSNRNPLIGTPDGYGGRYPRGARVDGSAGIFDYRAGVLSLPLWTTGYTPEPSPAWRPSVGFGVTPMTGFRVGVSSTFGPYLNDSYTSAQLKGAAWKSFNEGIYAWDIQYSRGYFEGHVEGAFSTYDIPGRTDTQNGFQWYGEGKYTFTPRFFLAARGERNDYPFIRAFGPNWTSANSVVSDIETGGGFRPTATTLMKMSVRKDHWGPNPNPQAPHDNGYALVFQLSQSFDAVELLTRKQ